MGHKSSEAGSDSEYSERQLRTKTRRNKKNINKISPDGGLQFDGPRNGNNNRIIPEEGPVEMNYRKPPVRTAVLLMDLCCDGCTKKISRTVTNSAGFRLLSVDKQANTMTVEGPNIRALADLLESKFKKSVEIAPAEGGRGEEKDRVVRGGDGATKAVGKELDGNKSNKPPVTTVELKMAVPCGCDGHLLQIRKSVTKTKGCHSCEMSSDEMGKAVVSVTGTMAVNALKEKLEKKLKTSVEITRCPPILGDLDHGGPKNKRGRKQRK